MCVRAQRIEQLTAPCCPGCFIRSTTVAVRGAGNAGQVTLLETDQVAGMVSRRKRHESAARKYGCACGEEKAHTQQKERFSVLRFLCRASCTWLTV